MKKFYILIMLAIPAFSINAMQQHVIYLTPGQQSFCYNCQSWVGGQDQQFHSCPKKPQPAPAKKK